MKNFSLSSKLFDIFNYCFFFLLSLAMLFPFINVLTLSLEPNQIAIQTGVIHLFPKQFTLAAYYEVFRNPMIFKSFFNSTFITVIGSILGVLITAMMAYGLTNEKMPGQKTISFLVLFSMMFSGGIIPSYILIKKLGMINSLWSLIIPPLMEAYNIILMRSFFKSLPLSLIESAKIDGCSEIGIFFKIILPLSKPIIATITLFIAVSRWNSFFDAVMYISSTDKKPLQVILREILIQNSEVETRDIDLGENVKMATIIVATIPILMVYPFLQKHFAKGILLGAIKG